jgi:hypothetical protein
MDMRFGTWNVRSLHRAGSLMTVSRELAIYKLDLVGVLEVRLEGGGIEHEMFRIYNTITDSTGLYCNHAPLRLQWHLHEGG